MSGAVLSFDHDLSEELLVRLNRALKTARKKASNLVKSLGQQADRAPGKLIDEDTVAPGVRVSVQQTSAWGIPGPHAHPRLPQVSNTDGELLEFQSLHYPLLPATTETAVRDSPGVRPGTEPRE